jgi:hypothetical protein
VTAPLLHSQEEAFGADKVTDPPGQIFSGPLAVIVDDGFEPTSIRSSIRNWGDVDELVNRMRRLAAEGSETDAVR